MITMKRLKKTKHVCLYLTVCVSVLATAVTLEPEECIASLGICVTENC